MRADRVTRTAVQAAWHAVKGVYRGTLTLPHIDIDAIFGERKTITWREALRAIDIAIDTANK